MASTRPRRRPQLEPPPPEERAIERLLRAAGPPAGEAHGLRVPPGDDAVVLADGWCWSTDLLVEGVHFDDRSSPADVGWKAVAVSVSDIGAMGVRPTVLLLAVSLRRDGDAAFVEGLAEGVGAACRRFGVTLVGGDTTRCSGARTLTSTVGGRAHGPVLTRAGGRPGDDVWVTGSLGLAGVGWSTDDPSEAALSALRRPVPPVALGVALAEAGLAHAAMDLSDGLATDLPRLCRASGVGARIEPDALPGAPGVSLRHQVHGGDDYELLFTADPARASDVRASAAAHGVQVTRIGALTDDPAVTLVGTAWPEPLFAHFSRSADGAAESSPGGVA